MLPSFYNSALYTPLQLCQISYQICPLCPGCQDQQLHHHKQTTTTNTLKLLGNCPVQYVTLFPQCILGQLDLNFTFGTFNSQGPSINDVSPKREGGGYKKCPKRRRLLVDLRRQGYPKNLKFGKTSFMDGPLPGLNRVYGACTLTKWPKEQSKPVQQSRPQTDAPMASLCTATNLGTQTNYTSKWWIFMRNWLKSSPPAFFT